MKKRSTSKRARALTPLMPAAIRVRRYWMLTVLGALVPVLIGVPFLMDAVPRAILLAVAFAAWRTAKVMRPKDQGTAWIFKLGLLTMMGAVGLMLLVSIAYVVRTGESIPGESNAWQLLAGVSYFVALHFFITQVIEPRWPVVTREPGLKA